MLIGVASDSSTSAHSACQAARRSAMAAAWPRSRGASPACAAISAISASIVSRASPTSAMSQGVSLLTSSGVTVLWITVFPRGTRSV